MTYNTRSTKQAESSQQGSLREMQHEFQGFMEGSDDKFGKLQEQIGKLLSGMNGLLRTQEVDDGEFTDDSDNEFIEDSTISPGHRGVFRDPAHAAKMRQKQVVTGKDKKNEEGRSNKAGGSEGMTDVNSLKHLKLTFPSLKEGGDAVEWLRDCEEYFSIFEVSNNRKAAIAAMHMTGTPRSWYKSFMVGRERVTWQQFTQAFLARFGELETELVFDKFKKLQQVSTVEQYFDEFEKCRGQLLSKIPSLTSEYFLENFIGGLQIEIRGMIRLLEPSSLEQALKLARFYEQTQLSQPKKTSSYKVGISQPPASKFSSEGSGIGLNAKSNLVNTTKTAELINSKPRPLTYSQREERRLKGLCFYCDEKFVKGHECKKPQNFLMVAEVECSEEYEGAPIFDEDPNEGEVDATEQKFILSALQIQEVRTKGPLYFQGKWQGKQYKVLIDGGSSLNFISTQLCEDLGLQTEKQTPVKINLPNGAILKSNEFCPKFRMRWGDLGMDIKVHVVDLLDWHIILGVEWLEQLGEFRCNYNQQTLQFTWKNEEVVLTPDSAVEFMAENAQITEVVPLWMEQIEGSYEGDEEIQNIITELTVDKSGPKEYHMRKGLLLYKGKWVIGGNGGLRRQVFDELHSQSVGGHSGQRATLKRLKEYFYWSTMGQTVGKWIRECANCQQNKGEHVRSPGYLQPLHIPNEPWRDIAMDFITGLPKSRGNEVIWVIVDRFSRYSHFLALPHPITAKSLSLVFFEHCYKLHGLPESIVSDRDSLFLSEFWQNLFKLSGTRLNMSTAYHPQSDGSTERVNQCLEQYLRNMTSEVPKNWSSWLAAAEWWYNTTFHTALNTTPYQIVYGTKPRHLVWQERVHTNIHSLETMIQEKQQQWNRLRELLEAAQVKMKRYADAKRTEREFQKGDWVYLKLQPYRQVTVAIRKSLKLSAKYFGPYEILEKVGKVAYKLALPETSRVHPVFHVSQLKKAIGQSKVQKQLPQVTENGTFDLSPLRQLDNRSILRDHKMVYQKLIQWKGCSVDEATWEDEDLLLRNFPEFGNHEDMV